MPVEAPIQLNHSPPMMPVVSTIRALHISDEPISDEMLDQQLGLRFYETETSIPLTKYDRGKIWLQGPKQHTQTSYAKIRQIYRHLILRKRSYFYDLGSGYGRVLLYGASLFPDVSFQGVEMVTERAQETMRIARDSGLYNVEVINDNVLDVDFSNGLTFYLFNPFPSLMGQVLDRLQCVATSRKITVVTYGKTTGEIMDIPWLAVTKSLGQSKNSLCIYQSR